jgi:hemoglobin
VSNAQSRTAAHRRHDGPRLRAPSGTSHGRRAAHDVVARRLVDVQAPTSVFEAAGGMPFFEALVDRFYDGVTADPVLIRLYPDADDLSGARRRLTLFLAQYWGGPSLYVEERGHPRLRMRHAPFAIGPEERDRWLGHMRAALDELSPAPAVRAAFEQYLDMAAEAMRNRD